MDRFLVGSNAFFKSIKGFISKDVDVLELIDNPKHFKDYAYIQFPKKCVFQYRKMNLDEWIDYTLKVNCPMDVGKFLVPEFAKEIGLTIYDLSKFEILIGNLDDKHLYEKIIYNSYLQNNDFTLTEDQLNLAYNEYKKYRPWIQN